MPDKRRAPARDISKYIRLRGAGEHNLKNIDLDIPRNQLVVMTGLSGSGKSSLAFDTIYAEGQRRYMESLSSYARMPGAALCTVRPAAERSRSRLSTRWLTL